MNIQHSSSSDVWYTPLNILARTCEVLGPIDLDPASDEHGNRRVGAGKYYTREQDGLTLPWHGTLFINPPGGKRGNKSMPALFWQTLMAARESGNIRHAIFLAFSAEALQNTQGKGVPSICDFNVCIPAKRLKFDTAAPVLKNSPSHSNAIVYVPGTANKAVAFETAFRDVGAIMRGLYA